MPDSNNDHDAKDNSSPSNGGEELLKQVVEETMAKAAADSQSVEALREVAVQLQDMPYCQHPVMVSLVQAALRSAFLPTDGPKVGDEATWNKVGRSLATLMDQNDVTRERVSRLWDRLRTEARAS